MSVGATKGIPASEPSSGNATRGTHSGAEAGGDEGEGTGHLAALAHQMRLDAGGGAGIEGDGAQVEPSRNITRSRRSRSRTLTWVRRGEGVAPGEGEDERVVEEGVVTTSGSVDRQDDKRQVDLARGDLGQELV